MKKIIAYLTISLLISSCAINSKQETRITYDEESALQDLEKDFKDISSGKSISLNTALVDYIYINQSSFPSLEFADSDADKIQLILPVYGQINSVLLHNAMKNIGYFDTHYAKLFSILGTMTAKLTPVMASFFDSLDRSDPSYSVRAEGMNRTYNGTRQFLIGYFSVLFVETDDKEIEHILLSNLKSFGPIIIGSLPIEYRVSTKSYIKQTIGKNVKVDLVDDYNVMLAKF